MTAFAITSTTDRVRLDSSRAGRAPFTVTNTSGRDLSSRATVAAEGPAQAGWFAVPNPERPSPAGSTQQFDVQIAVPASAWAGVYRFRLDVVGVEDPDEYAGQGPWTMVEVPPALDDHELPWRWILLAVAAFLVLVAGGVVAWIVTHPGPGELRASADFTDFSQFGPVQVGHASRASVVVVSNAGGSGLRMQAAALSGANAQDFVIVTDGCKGRELQAKATCTVQVALVPKSQGDKQASLRIAADDQSQTINYKGVARA